MASACGSWYLLWWGWGEDTKCVALGNRGEFGGGIILDQGEDKVGTPNLGPLSWKGAWVFLYLFP